MKTRKFYKSESSAIYRVSKSERCLGYEFEGTLEEIKNKYDLETDYVEDVVGALENKKLFLFRKELELSHVFKGVVAKGDIVNQMIDYVAELLKNEDFPDIDYNLEELMENLNEHSDYSLNWVYEMEV